MSANWGKKSEHVYLLGCILVRYIFELKSKYALWKKNVIVEPRVEPHFSIVNALCGNWDVLFL